MLSQGSSAEKSVELPFHFVGVLSKSSVVFEQGIIIFLELLELFTKGA